MNTDTDEIIPVPSLLVQTFTLESYLRNFSEKLSSRLSLLQTSLATLRDDVKTLSMRSERMKAFLREQTVLALHEKIIEAGLPLSDERSFQSLLPAFLRDGEHAEGEQTEPIPVSLAGFREEDGGSSTVNTVYDLVVRLNREIAMQRKIRAEEDRIMQKQKEESYMRIETMCDKLRETQNEHMSRLERFTYWLKPGQQNVGATDVFAVCTDEGGAPNTDQAPVLKLNTVDDMREVVQSAPLFLEFRRILLRDVEERFAGVREEQLMEFASVGVAQINELRQEMLDRNYHGRGGMDTEPDFSQLDFAGRTEHRLRSTRHSCGKSTSSPDQAEVKESTAVRSSIDDSVLHLERRLQRRIESLEERMSLYEAERKEFRKILTAIIGARAQRAAASSAVGQCKSAPSETASLKGSRSSTFVVRESVDPRRPLGDECAPLAKVALEALKLKESPRLLDKRQMTQRARGTAPSAKPRQSPEPTPRRPQGKLVEVSGCSGCLSIGMTANQEAYARYVTGEFNTRRVESLPPLPYERIEQK
ncbi:hypothetical protein ERJ75_000533800 [Trypanosoma vivax]|uniref:Uncharacterized protein n=1 Tax=Trypanosoma vivax (strain Y486) TaxID=1055687 RepID=G0TS66_TRYVY|nr:hypothetical protein TRVL_04078 [Trypanosoma vivax]KAH8615916.1 hypothetical protein ERJ75_000533800 [Trypanosoma vivax]CCC46791.1 conserved hypothetical protein [Trypanosoma vivax Y486]